MSVFSPYTIYGARLPVRRVGELIKAGKTMWQIVAVRHNRQKFTIAGPTTTNPTLLNETLDAKYQALNGNIDVFRIVHMQYLALGTSTSVILYWQTDPLGSKWVKITFDNTFAGLTNSLEVDRWSYDKNIAIGIEIDGSGSQDFYFEMVEYEVIEYAKALKQGDIYLLILPNGQARMMKVGE